MRCLADFILDSDLCLPSNSEPLILHGPDNSFVLHLSNSTEHVTARAVLSAQLVFEAESFENIRELATSKLTLALNSLAYATNRKFDLVLLKRVIDWTPGITEREAIIFTETPEWDIAEPNLNKGFIDTAERLLAMQSGDEQQAAMRWYRIGIQSETPEEQFTYFWFALEIASEALKGSDKVSSKCPRCGTPLYCESCRRHPTHRRYRGEAIQQIIERVHPNASNEIFETLQLVRHTLMHGRRITSILDRLPCTEEQAVNKIALVTWRAINLMFIDADPRSDAPLAFGYVDNMVRRMLVAGVHMSLGMGGDPNDPQLRDFPEVELAIEHLDDSRDN